MSITNGTRMSSVVYTDAPDDVADAIEHGEIVADFLPTPKELVGKINKKRITITLSERSIERFKRFAKKNRTPYQRLISEVVDAYSAKL